MFISCVLKNILETITNAMINDVAYLVEWTHHGSVLVGSDLPDMYIYTYISPYIYIY